LIHVSPSWADLQTLHLVVEILSPSSLRADRFTKRRLYQEQRVPAYWIFDVDNRQVEIWTPEALFPVVERERMVWRHPAASSDCVIDLATLLTRF
jgi:Uma2 family endonuclease